MENEIKVGNWIRDREGNITKIIETLSLFKDVELYLGEDGYQYSDNAIVKHSSNIIDLIQCGDYVNGEIIDQIQNDRNPKLLWHLSSYGDDDIAFENEDIETIVTKEMMESISYKVKE